MIQNRCSTDILNKSTPLEIFFLMKMRKRVKLSAYNQWRVVHNGILDFGGVVNWKMSIIRKRILLKMLLSSLLGLLHSLKACDQRLSFILL